MTAFMNFQGLGSFMAAASAMMLSSCSTFFAGGSSLAALPQVQQARSVLISQSPELESIWVHKEHYRVLYLKTTRQKLPMPGPSVDELLIQYLPQGIQGKRGPFENPVKLPPDMAQRLMIGDHSKYQSMTPRRDADLMIVLIPAGAASSSGYYNPAIGTYISGASTPGGHFALIDIIGPPNLSSQVEALVYSCQDGSFVGRTKVSAMLRATDLSEANRLSELCARKLVELIFGTRQ